MPLGYGTVRDYCDSVDHIPIVSRRQRDLKDLQRPWMIKAILGLCHPGARLLEIGGGEPLSAQILSELGYKVTIVDPYDGSGNGPSDFYRFRTDFPAIRFFRSRLTAASVGLQPSSFDCIFSISVLEHIPEPDLAALFSGIRKFLRPGALSIHAVDYVLDGKLELFHREQLISIHCYQGNLQDDPPPSLLREHAELMTRIRLDADVYFLGPEGHNLWRGTVEYGEYPYQKVTSIYSVKTLKSH